MMDNNVLEMKNISKSFAGVKVLESVDFSVKKGTIHALMGENGAGKSTLVKIIIGMYLRDEGEITFLGKPLDVSKIDNVLKQGISMVYQELNPLDNMTVAENIFVGREPYKLGKLVINKRKMTEDATILLNKLGLNNIKAHEKVSRLSIAQKQLLEIAKAVSYDSKLIILDEPTSAISEKECKLLFSIVNKLKHEGISFIFISHKLDEIFEISDEVTVLRDGKLAGTAKTSDLTKEKLIEMMVGKEITNLYPKEHSDIGDTILSVRNMSCAGKFSNISFNVRKGEILGVAGLMGAGRTEVMEALFGVRKTISGEIFLNGKKVKIRKPSDAIKLKISFLTEDRKKNGCFLPLSVRDNMLALSWGKCIQTGILNRKLMNSICTEEIKKFSIKTTGVKQVINRLSGGNQQKILVSRWLLTEPDILILDEPTRGIDVGAKAEIHKIMSQLAKKGKAIIMISSEMPEILGMSDRILVMSDGKVTGILNRDEVNKEEIMNYATGLKTRPVSC